MAETASGAKSDLLKRIEKSWSALDGLVTRLGDTRLSSPRDREGWAVKDHLIHIAVWEDSVSALFQGKPRHLAMGLDEATYQAGSVDEMNRRIHEQRRDVSGSSVVEQLRASHKALMAFVEATSEADLVREAGEAFPASAPGEQRSVLQIIDENTAEHFEEHRGWIEALLAGS
jgi:hypothetical protein